LPNLILEACSAIEVGAACVAIDPEQLVVVAANRAAEQAGVVCGLQLSAALAISPVLDVRERSIEAETARLQSLAIWARTLTPAITCLPPNMLLLEVRGSLKLFGGIENIKLALQEQLERRGLSSYIAVAPTANGALWLSRMGNSMVASVAELLEHLRELPLGVTAWPESILKHLAEMGLRRIGDVLRLPRGGFAQRAGAKYLRELDAATGREADPRPVTKLPEVLAWRIDLPDETDASRLLLEAAEIAFEKLEFELRKRQRQIDSFEFSFFHLHREPTVARFELMEPSRDKGRLLELLSCRLEHMHLPAPTLAVELNTGELQEMRLDHPDLFADEGAKGRRIDTAVIERLRERFGPKSVYGIDLATDHRPEAAWLPCAGSFRQGAADMRSISPWAEERPLWLLDAPRTLNIGNLCMESGPERIEGGWWDCRDVSRDYYTATKPTGERLWVYRDNFSHEWYLHGLFG
jgi:protein ImuB